MIRPSIAAEDEALTPSPSDVHAQAEPLADESIAPNEGPSVMREVLAAPFRGVESAVRNAYNGVDYITGDALPDYNGDKKTNFLGNSQTMPGAVIENVTQFLTAFVPVVGVAGRAAGALGLAGKAATVAGGMGAGAFADFVAFSGHEDRLSNLIEKYPQLSNPVSAYLSAKDDDSEAEGRFKNALEGLALGALVDPLAAALKSMAHVRKVKVGELSADAAKKLVGAAEGRVASGVKTVRMAEADKSVAATIKAKPEIADLSTSLSEIKLDDLGGGGLFQSPEKDIGRFIDSPAEVDALLESTSRKRMEAELASGAARSETIEVRSQRVAGVYAELVGSDTNTVLATLEANSTDLLHATYKAEAGAVAMLKVANEAAFYAKLAAEGKVAPGFETVEQTMLQSLKSQEVLSALVTNVKQSGTIVGRALNARKFIKSAEVQSTELARAMVDQFGGSKFISKELEKVALAGASENAMDAARGVSALVGQQLSVGSRVLRAHNEYWINAILSGTKTSFINTLGNATTTLYQPLEQAIGSLFQKDSKAVSASLRNYRYLANSVGDSWKFFMRSLKENKSVLLDDSRVVDLQRGNAIDAAKLLKDGVASQGFVAEAKAVAAGGEGNMLSHFVNFMGESTRMPTRLLTATDEFFKQINYRAAAKTELHYRGLNQGLSGEALDSFIEENFSRIITDGGSRLSEGAVIREGIAQAEAKGLQGKAQSDFLRDYVGKNYDAKKSALAENFDVTGLAQGVAEEATFTRPLGDLGKGVQNFAASHPITQLLIPFVRTPTNIVKYFGQRGLGITTYLPGIGRLQARNLAELTSENALVRSRAAGRIATGSAIVSMAGLTAASGRITGKGPMDEHERKLLMQTGWQPYSVKFDSSEGPVYVSYQRLDPFATFFGLIADWSEQAKRMDPQQTDVLQGTLTAMATAVSNNITNKTYLASLAQAIDAINQPDRKFATWSRARVGSYVPSIMAQWGSVTDDGQSMRELRGFFDGAINRIPGAQGMLEPKRNVLGEPVDSALASTPLSAVNPFTVTKAKNDAVFTELAKFHHGIQPPSPLTNGNVNLLLHKTEAGQTAFDRWQQLTGEVSLGGHTMRESLSRLIKNSAYQKLPLTSPADGIDSPRLAEVKRVINTYRRAALYQLQKEVPSVRQAIRSSMEAQVAIRRGDKATALASVNAVIQAAQ